MYDWNDLRYFLELARRGKLSAAAVRLGVDHTTVARRITALEDALGVSLFDRANRSYTLTADGQRLLASAEKVETSSLSLLDEIKPENTGPIGSVRFATPEAFGSQFLTPFCVNFHAHYPGINLEVIAETREWSLTRREADAAITLAKPSVGRVTSKKLGDYKLALYAAPSYLQKHAPIVRLNDLANHQFVWYVDELLPVPELKMLDKAISDPNVVFRTTSVTGQANAAAAGMGIALLPCYLADPMKTLTTVLPREISILRELWFACHEDLQTLPHIEALQTFMQSLIASERRSLLGERH